MVTAVTTTGGAVDGSTAGFGMSGTVRRASAMTRKEELTAANWTVETSTLRLKNTAQQQRRAA